MIKQDKLIAETASATNESGKTGRCHNDSIEKSVITEELAGIKAENEYMQIAINEALKGITEQHGGPFGSVVVKEGKVVGQGHNQVLLNHDPTLHGEIFAIRDAGERLGCFSSSSGRAAAMCRWR